MSFRTSRLPRSRALAAVAAAAALALAGCGSDDDAGSTSSTGGSGGSGEEVTLRLGYFPNVTHATALVGVEKGFFQKALGDGVTLETSQFNAGPAAIEALFSGAIDATYIGPNPTVNGFTQSQGEAVRVVAGAASGGAFLVVREGIDDAQDLKGTTLATPQLGNTQDVALRYWLKQQGLATSLEGGGDVTIAPQENAQILDAFAAGAIDGAWVPEPNATRLLDAGAKVLVDEKDLWPDGKFVTTNLIVNPEFLEQNPEVVKGLVQGSVDSNAWLNANAAEAQQVVGDAIAELSGKPLPEGVVAKAWGNITFTDDPVPSSLLEGAKHAAEVGTLEGGEPDLDGLYDLGALNEVLEAAGQPPVAQP
jgi:NitT/TauT family transport system substrate-binding protein